MVLALRSLWGATLQLQNIRTPQVWKHEQNTKILQNPPFRVGPGEHETNKEKSRKWPENDHFRKFSVFFWCFSGPTQDGGFCTFFWYFFVLPDLRRSCLLWHPKEILN